MTGECKKHGSTPFSENKIRPRCRRCNVEKVQARREKVKKILVEYKGGCCQKCGYDKCIAALEFHHIDEAGKDFNISHDGKTRSIESCKKEVDKCMLLCANCHREEHWSG